MSPWTKLTIGLTAAWAAGWISHAPLGQGQAFVDRLQADADRVVRAAEIPGVTARLPRDVLARRAILSGPADDFQRHGQGSLPGLNARIRAVPGISGVQWADETPTGRAMPLLLETLLLIVPAFLIGLGLGWVFFRPRRQGYL